MAETALPLAAGTWQIDPVHSAVEFKVRHMGLSRVRGQFKEFTSTLNVGDSLENTKLETKVDLASINTNNADRDEHLKGTDFFNVEQHPEMTFTSTSIAEANDAYQIAGDLSINGVTKPVTLDAEFFGAETSPMENKLRAGFAASGEISRKEFGIEFNIPMGGDKVVIGDKIDIEIEAEYVEPES